MLIIVYAKTGIYFITTVVTKRLRGGERSVYLVPWVRTREDRAKLSLSKCVVCDSLADGYVTVTVNHGAQPIRSTRYSSDSVPLVGTAKHA